MADRNLVVRLKAELADFKAKFEQAGKASTDLANRLEKSQGSLDKLSAFATKGGLAIAAGLGFLGLGVLPPTPEWGLMISSGRKFLFEQWWVATMPGLAIFIVSLGFNLLGDGLRDVLDPRSAGK